MARHFITLYLIVVLAIAAVSWTQERLWLAYSRQAQESDASLASLVGVIEHQLRATPVEKRNAILTELADSAKLEMELLDLGDIAGDKVLARLARGETALMQTSHGDEALLKQIDANSVLSIQYRESTRTRGLLEWLLALLLYAVIALAVMIWIWPLTRDLRKLQLATATFGNRSWLFHADIGSRSQVYALAETFRKMAARIDGLIESHKVLSNAVAHEIKTPLSRMQFEIEAAQRSTDVHSMHTHLRNIKGDIADMNALVTATLDYAVLERADMALNLAHHDFTKIVPAIVEYVQRNVHTSIALKCTVAADATHVYCDAYLLETVIRNLLVNATRFAKQIVEVTFIHDSTGYRLYVDDDGPGIPEQDRARVFGSFVQLAPAKGSKTGFGLGLAIVRRVMEWHGGTASIATSPLGGARVVATWMSSAPRSN